MNLKNLISKQSLTKLSKLNGLRYLSSQSSQISSSLIAQNPRNAKSNPSFNRQIHTTRTINQSTKLFHDPNLDSDDPEEEDATLNEFLSRFVWIMRGKVKDAYPESDKPTVDAMLLMIVGNVVAELEKGGIERMVGSAVSGIPSGEFSEDLWRTMWEVSNKVLEDMNKERKKERMKQFLQSEEVKEMWRFAGEIGIKGDMLRELRFKWAREKMEEAEFYESLDRMKKNAITEERGDVVEVGTGTGERKSEVLELPKRHGKFKFRIYGLDLSDPKWAEVANRVHESEEIVAPQEPKEISGKSKLTLERILSLKEEDDPKPLLVEWVELLEPSRVDWIALLNRLKEKNIGVYYKVAELVLDEKSFQANIRDYSKLIEAHSKDNRLEDAERILTKMSDSGFVPDILTATVLIHMYSKVGNLDRAKEAFEILRSQDFKPDIKVYNAMVMAYVNANQPKLAESLVREMEAEDIKPTKELYMALLRSYSQNGDDQGASRISNTMQFAGFQSDWESCSLLLEAAGQAGKPDQAKSNFDYMIKLGHKPDDKCTSIMIAAYQKENSLDKALNLLLQLEKDGFEPGIATYTVLVDWLGRLQLVDEVEQLLGKIAEQGEAPSVKLHVSLCDMYSRVGNEKKALQSLGVLEAKKQELSAEEFERIINGLVAGGFRQEAQRLHGLMIAQGYTESKHLRMSLMASQAMAPKRPTMR